MTLWCLYICLAIATEYNSIKFCENWNKLCESIFILFLVNSSSSANRSSRDVLLLLFRLVDASLNNSHFFYIYHKMFSNAWLPDFLRIQFHVEWIIVWRIRRKRGKNQEYTVFAVVVARLRNRTIFFRISLSSNSSNHMLYIFRLSIEPKAFLLLLFYACRFLVVVLFILLVKAKYTLIKCTAHDFKV